ncbi:MAG: poly-gamma-glutamate hydrolase family protein [Nanoarchaeota archaeon]|nr:poly-gamma-glutamate hydrolase family protein [Nanoarchaeota archaeon]MCG2718114.1 poly-gamma-glutamate hydrolase family protein [Nanoarchaeota archaeon]
MADHYKSLDKLKKDSVEGIDYKEILLDRSSDVTIMAIHGGIIERGTAQIAETIAGNDLNYFSFSGLKKPRIKYHITSHKFNHDGLAALLKNSDIAVSFHGTRKKGLEDYVSIGGLNEKLKGIIMVNLALKDFNVDTKNYPAKSYKNVANRPKNNGVQLELGRSLRNSFFDNIKSKKRKPTISFYKFTDAIRRSIEYYYKI